MTQRREQRIIPLLVLLIGWLSNRLGLSSSTLGYPATSHLHGLLDGLAVTPRQWLIGSFWTLPGLLLLLSRFAGVASCR